MRKAAPANTGLLGKVARFITNPTANSNRLERFYPPDARQLPPQARPTLKEMIERKRRNDFVRKREFDMLRKIRREGKPDDALKAAELTLSYTSSQLAPSTDRQESEHNQRAQTLRKIDEIEAQISRSWFRKSSDAPTTPARLRAMQDQPDLPVLTQTYQPELTGSAKVMAQHSALEIEQASWTSPPQLNVRAWTALASAVKHAAPSWRIDWRAVKTIEQNVLPQLSALLTQWADTPAHIQFLGGDHLLAVLAGQSPTGDRAVDPMWWSARLALLRLMGDPDRFDQTALDYCITYEISPPAWTPPKGSYSGFQKYSDAKTSPRQYE